MVQIGSDSGQTAAGCVLIIGLSSHTHNLTDLSSRNININFVQFFYSMTFIIIITATAEIQLREVNNMQNENIVEVNEVKSVTITESKLTELFVEATDRIIKKYQDYKSNKSDAPNADTGKFILVTMLTGAKFIEEIAHLLFDEDSNT